MNVDIICSLLMTFIKPSAIETSRTMSPQVDDETTFTLSYGGVEFCLAPSSCDASAATNDVMCISKICNGEVMINLNGFSGTLHVKNHNKIAAADSSDLPVATEDIMGEKMEDDNMMDVEAPASPNPAVDAAAAAVALASSQPNPVEDTPSPEARSNLPEQKQEDDDKPKNRKGQQKLNFGKKGKKQSNKAETKRQSAASKRSPVEEELKDSTTTKKSRKSTMTMKPDQNELFDDIIEEPNTTNDKDSAEEKKEDENNAFAFTSLGQTMFSQENKNADLSLETAGIGDNNKLMSPETLTVLSTISSKQKPSNNGNDNAPCPRWGQTMTMIDHKRFIVYGGQTIEQDEPKPLSDLYVYDLMEHAWTKPINCEGVARTWHSANFLPERQLLLCFGGEILDEKSGNLTTTNQTMVLDCEIMLWYPPTVSGQVPSGRSGHSGCVLPQTNELVVFGGVKNGKWLNSVSILDTNRWKWSTLKAVGDAPPPRSYHSATALGSDICPRVVIFGGNNGSKCFNGVHVLEASGENKKWVWSNPKCKGETPSPRTGHSAALLNDGSTILVYGGWDPNTEDENGDDLIFGDSFLLDTKTWTWRKGPSARYASKNNAVANGGAERVGHSAVLAPGSDGVQVLAFGGRVHENKFAGDFQSLSVQFES